MITMEANFIIVSLKEIFLKYPTKRPKPKSTGTVERPKTNITIPPQKGEVVLAAEAAKKYTRPQGKKPFNMPRRKKLRRLFECISFEKDLLTKELVAKDDSIDVKNLILPIKEYPIRIIKIPITI